MRPTSKRKIYFDPADEPVEGGAVLLTSPFDRRRKWRGYTAEECLIAYITSDEDESQDWIFRRVDDVYAPLCLQEIVEPKRKRGVITGTPGRVLARYRTLSSFQRTISIDAEKGRLWGVVEVYMDSDDYGVSFSYLDRTGKVRPLPPLIIDGEAVAPYGDEDFLREEVEWALADMLEPVYQYPSGER